MKFPPDWQVVRLKDIVLDMQPGFAQRPGENGSIGQIRTHNVTPDGRISLKGLKKVNPSENESNKYSLQPGDIIFNNTNSEEWVGKTALYEENDLLTFSNHMTRIRVDNDVILPAFLSRYLHFLWNIGFSRTRAKRWVSQAGIDQQELSKFEVPLPSLIEQQRIVYLIKKTDELRLLRRDRPRSFSILRRNLFSLFFGKFKELEKDKFPLGRITNFITSGSRDWSKYYSNSSHDAIFIRVQNVKKGWLDFSDVAHVSAPENSESTRTRVQPFDLLVSITGSIGQVAIVPENIGEAYISQHVALVRTDLSVPVKFLAEYLNHPAGGQLQINRANYGQTKPGLNLEQIKKLNIPVIDQRKLKPFLDTLKKVEFLINDTIITDKYLENLYTNLSNQAFFGTLTAQWRDSKFGTVYPKKSFDKRLKNKVTITETAPEERAIAQLHHRHSLFDQLSEIQIGVLQEIRHQWRGTLIPSEDLEEFMERSFQVEHLEDASDQIKHALNQLAGLGLIAKISLPNQAGVYVTGYRGLREDELTKASDINSITKKTVRQSLEQKY